MRLNSTTLEVPQRLQGSDIRHPLRDVASRWLGSGGRLGQLGHVDVVERNSDPQPPSELNESFCRARWHGLPPLVMPHIALGAAHASGKFSLGYTKALSDGFNSAHGVIMSGACIVCQHCHCYLFLVVAVMI